MSKKIDVSSQEWEKIKTEYITTDTSYRKLSDKYGVGYTRLQKRGFDEDWQAEREAYKEKLLKKSVELICDEEANSIARAIRIGNAILDKVEESLKDINMAIAKEEVTTKTKTFDGEKNFVEKTVTKETYGMVDVGIDRAGLKQLSSVLRDLREIGIFRSELDRNEQIARIDKLRKDTEEDDKDTMITVVIDDELKRLSK